MGIRVQSREIEIAADEPFKGDLLDRREAAETLTHVLRRHPDSAPPMPALGFSR